MFEILLLFVLVFFLNVIPVIAPPTWMVFSFLGFQFPEHMGVLLALVGALAAQHGKNIAFGAHDRAGGTADAMSGIDMGIPGFGPSEKSFPYSSAPCA